jgi:hypothetical protein
MPQDMKSGDLIGGKCRLHQQLGAEAMGVVRQAIRVANPTPPRRREARWFAAGLLLAPLVAGTPALAQSSGALPTKAQATSVPGGGAVPAAPADRDKEARRLYQQGLQALNAKQWEAAREALLAALKLKPHPQIAANLGHAEFMGGRFRDAAEHLSFVVREAPNMGEKDRQDIEKMLEVARAKIGIVTVRVNVEGAKVLMDAHEVGVSPLAVPLFVEPGSRVFEAQKGGLATGRHEIEVAAGSAPVVELTLTSIEPSALGSQPPPQSGKGAPGGAVIVKPAWPPWRIGAVVGGAGLAAVGIGLGIGFSAAAASQNRGAIAERDYLVVRTEVGNLICPVGENDPRCQKLTEFANARDTYRNVAIASFVVSGVAMTGALVAALWRPGKPAEHARTAPSFMIVPSPQGAVVTGSF